MIPISISETMTQRIVVAACALVADHARICPHTDGMIIMPTYDALVTYQGDVWTLTVYLGTSELASVSPCLRPDVVSVMGSIQGMQHMADIAAALEAQVIARQQQRIVAAFGLGRKAAA